MYMILIKVKGKKSSLTFLMDDGDSLTIALFIFASANFSIKARFLIPSLWILTDMNQFQTREYQKNTHLEKAWLLSK